VGEETVPTEGLRHTSALIEVVDGLLRKANVAPRELRLVAVSMGPGSFTGLRIGVTFAKTLAYAVGCPVVGINSLHVVAESADPAGMRGAEILYVVRDAQRGDWFYQAFQRADQGGQGDSLSTWRPAWNSLGNREIIAAGSLGDRVRPGDIVAAPASWRHHDALMRLCIGSRQIGCTPQASKVALLGSWSKGSHSAPWSLVPDYGRLSSAEEKMSSDAGR
jgi:tRNA threonylcarbamoyladenosine biosynthesis protein TsaB